MRKNISNMIDRKMIPQGTLQCILCLCPHGGIFFYRSFARIPTSVPVIQSAHVRGRFLRPTNCGFMRTGRPSLGGCGLGANTGPGSQVICFLISAINSHTLTMRTMWIKRRKENLRASRKTTGSSPSCSAWTARIVVGDHERSSVLQGQRCWNRARCTESVARWLPMQTDVRDRKEKRKESEEKKPTRRNL